MKQRITALIFILSMVLAACNNNEVTIKKTAQTTSEKHLYSWEVLDTNGQRHNVKISPNGLDNSYLADMSSSFAQEGDLIREGKYQILLNDKVQNETIGEWVFNTMNQNSAHVIGNTLNLLVVSRWEVGNSYSDKLFYIHKGRVVEVKGPDGMGGFSHDGDHIYPINTDTFKLARFMNSDVPTYYQIYTYQILNFTNGKTKLIKEEQVSPEEADLLFNQLIQNR